MDRNDELTAAHERLRLSTAAYAEMVGADDALRSEREFDEILRRQERAQAAWEHYRRLAEA